MKKSLTSLRPISTTLFILGFILLCNQTAKAEDAVEDFWKDTQITGNIRDYYFTRDFTNPDRLSQAAFSMGGGLNLLSGDFLEGFKVGASVYTAQSLGLNSDNLDHVDRSLPGNDLTVLGQAFLQYSRDQFLIRAGDQIIRTPWLNDSDSRVIPATYRGFFGSWMPNQDWTIAALRIYQFKSRVADHFSATNVYNPVSQSTAIPELGDTTNPGAQALSIQYQTETLNTRLWGYQFMNFAKLFYLDGRYTFKTSQEINPFVGAQFLVEKGDGDNILERVSTGKVHSTGYGAITGITFPYADVSLSYNHLNASQNAYSNGDVLSPYTFAADPLYTTSMTAGLVDKTVGDAWKVSGTVYAFEKQLQVMGSFAKYYTMPYLANTRETDFDVMYTFNKSATKALRGLSLRNRLGVIAGDPTRGTFYYNRVMLQYGF